MPDAATWSLTIPVEKVDVDQRTLTGWAMLSEDAQGRPIVDLQGDMVLAADLEKAAHEAFLDGGRGKGGDMHQRQGVADLVESFVVTREKRTALGFGEGPAGWVVTLKVNDDALWGDVKSGRKLELSIRGTAERVAA